MHELSIVLSILEIAEATARQNDAQSIQKIRMRVGAFSSVAKDALEFAFEVARQGTMAENAILEIETVPLVAECAACGPATEPVQEFCLICPRCGLPLKIVSGDELEVDSIEIDSLSPA
jgi:hydrogenase nickel incorporation protein HypA/HybF